MEEWVSTTYLLKRGGLDFTKRRMTIMTTANNSRGFFRSALDSLVEARARQANRYVAGALLALDDETLAARGYDRASLRKQAVYFY